MNSSTGRHREDSRKRSRSPYDEARHYEDVKRRRSRSPHRRSHHHHRHHRHHHHHRREPVPEARLPYGASPLRNRDLDTFKVLFADYLSIQKQLDIEDLDENEVKGRWKSFFGKWNRGELAEGWYDPETKRKADARYAALKARKSPPGHAVPLVHDRAEDEDDDDGLGPAPPEAARHNRAGPAIPNVQDLQHRQELMEDDRAAQMADLRYERKLDRKVQKERLEELAPRAEPGSRERQLEKRRDAAVANREFRDAREAGAVEEVGDAQLMGGGEDDYKAKLKATERQKNEREIRKEEVLRARAAEREEKLAEHRRKEEKTMEMLRSLAKQRFG